MLGAVFYPSHKPYPYSIYRWGFLYLDGTWNLWWNMVALVVFSSPSEGYPHEHHRDLRGGFDRPADHTRPKTPKGSKGFGTSPYFRKIQVGEIFVAFHAQQRQLELEEKLGKTPAHLEDVRWAMGLLFKENRILRKAAEEATQIHMELSPVNYSTMCPLFQMTSYMNVPSILSSWLNFCSGLPIYSGKPSRLIQHHTWNFVWNISSLPKNYPPVPVPKFPTRKNQSGKSWVLLLGDTSQYDINSFTLGQMIQGLSRTVNWLRGKHKLNFLPAPTKNQVTSLKCYGFLGKPAGIPIRAHLKHQEEIDKWCIVHLKGQKSMDFKIPQHTDFDEWTDNSDSWWHFAKCVFSGYFTIFGTPQIFSAWMIWKSWILLACAKVFSQWWFFPLLLPFVSFTTLDLKFHSSSWSHLTHKCEFRVVLVGFFSQRFLNSFLSFLWWAIRPFVDPSMAQSIVWVPADIPIARETLLSPQVGEIL